MDEAALHADARVQRRRIVWWSPVRAVQLEAIDRFLVMFPLFPAFSSTAGRRIATLDTTWFSNTT
jgi:hypothetical protein